MVNSSGGVRKEEKRSALAKRPAGTLISWSRLAPAVLKVTLVPWTKPAIGVCAVLPPATVMGSFW